MKNNLAALVYLRSKLQKWRSIGFLSILLVLFLSFKLIFGNDAIGIEEDCIASVKIEGIIFSDDHRSEVLEKLAELKSVKAVIININSPGGGIVGSEILHNNLRAIAAKKPLVVIMDSVAASGGYMAAIASDYIIAHNGTLTGSIGVLMESPDVTALADKIGLKFNTYKSSPLKGSPSPFEKTNPLVDKVVKESIEDSYNFFVDLVKDRRGDKIKKNFANIVFDGRVFTGRQALEVGLIDKIGDKQEALSYLSTQGVGIKSLPIKKVSVNDKEDSFFEKFFGLIPFLSGQVEKSQSMKMMAIMQ